MAVFSRGCKPIFFHLNGWSHLRSFQVFYFALILKKKQSQNKKTVQTVHSNITRRVTPAQFLYYFKNKEYNVITKENSYGWIYFNRTNKASNLKNWDSFVLLRIFLFLFLLLLFLFLFFFAFRRLSKNKQNKSIPLFHNKLIFHSNTVFFSHYLLSKVSYNQRVRGV